MKVYKVEVEWDVNSDDEVDIDDIDLPTETLVEAENEEEIADALSDQYGWLVKNLSIKEVYSSQPPEKTLSKTTIGACDAGETYKVRAAITLAHYLLVKAASPDEAEKKAEKYIRDKDRHHGEYDWYGEASHMHTTYEVEEAE